MRRYLGGGLALLLILFGLTVAVLGIYHDLTHTCFKEGAGFIPPTFRQCVEWSP